MKGRKGIYLAALLPLIILEIFPIPNVFGDRSINMSLCWGGELHGSSNCSYNEIIATRYLGERNGSIVCIVQNADGWNGPFSWRHNGKRSLPPGVESVYGVTTGTLVFPPLQPHFEGNYSCYVTTDVGEKSARLELVLRKGYDLPVPSAIKFKLPGWVSVPKINIDIPTLRPPRGTLPPGYGYLDDGSLAKHVDDADDLRLRVDGDEGKVTTGGGQADEDSSFITLEGSLLILIIAIPLIAVLCCVVYLAGTLVKSLACLMPGQEEAIVEFLYGWGYVRFVDAPVKLRYDPKYEIDPLNLRIDFENVLGHGEFGKVYRGQLVQPGSFSNKALAVAVKTVKDDVDVGHFKALLEEVKILIHAGSHHNLVGLVGVYSKCVQTRKLWFVMEFCEKGSLRQYLREHQQSFVNLVEEGVLNPEKLKRAGVGEDEISTFKEPFHTGLLFKWVLDIALGLNHLHQRKVIHGDIAVRNILLSGSLVGKISDFGLAKQLLGTSDYTRNGEEVPLPWRHMAPESLTDRMFTKKSDVWAFGVTIWEIFRLGGTPYLDRRWGIDFLKDLKTGMRLIKPPGSTTDIYGFISRCWEIEPRLRPNVSEVIPICTANLRNIQRSTAEYVQLDE